VPAFKGTFNTLSLLHFSFAAPEPGY